MNGCLDHTDWTNLITVLITVLIIDMNISFSSKNASSNDDGMIELKLDPHANKTEHVLKQDHQEEDPRPNWACDAIKMHRRVQKQGKEELD